MHYLPFNKGRLFSHRSLSKAQQEKILWISNRSWSLSSAYQHKVFLLALLPSNHSLNVCTAEFSNSSVAEVSERTWKTECVYTAAGAVKGLMWATVCSINSEQTCEGYSTWWGNEVIKTRFFDLELLQQTGMFERRFDDLKGMFWHVAPFFPNGSWWLLGQQGHHHLVKFLFPSNEKQRLISNLCQLFLLYLGIVLLYSYFL